MKAFKKQCAQGDILITRIEKLPKGLREFSSENGEFIVAHSETGHHHVILDDGLKVYEAANDEFVLFLVVDNPVMLEHKRSFDTHAPIEIGEGIYRINRQREYISEGFRRAAD